MTEDIHNGGARYPHCDRTFVWDGWLLLLERIDNADGSSQTVESFWGSDLSGTEQGAGGVGGLLAVSVDGQYYFPCSDHNGNVMAYVSESGAIVAQYTYTPFGEVMSAAGPMAGVFRFRFSTKYQDEVTGLYYYGYRFYDPAMGRFISRDPIGERGGLNLYGFVGNDPVNRWDALGLFTIVGKAENFSHDEIQKAIADGFSNNIGAIREPLQHAVRENWGNMTFVISDNNDPDCAGKVDPLTSYTRKGSANVGTLRDVEIISTLSTGQKLRVVRLKYWFNSAKLCKCQLKTLSQYGLTALHEAAHNVGWGGAYKDDNDPKFDNLPPDIVGHPSGWGVPSGGDVK